MARTGSMGSVALPRGPAMTLAVSFLLVGCTSHHAHESAQQEAIGVKRPQSGAWKEGRIGGASLCYVGLDEKQLATAARHHAAVGIRATVVCDQPTAVHRVLAGRNWDLALPGARAAGDAQIATALTGLDGREQRGVVWHSGEAKQHYPGAAFVVVQSDRVIMKPTPDLSRPLPARPLPTNLASAKDAIDRVVIPGHWAIWIVDADTFERLTPAGHEALLKWLGTHHARIWCAPVRDVAEWVAPDDGSVQQP